MQQPLLVAHIRCQAVATQNPREDLAEELDEYVGPSRFGQYGKRTVFLRGRNEFWGISLGRGQKPGRDLKSAGPKRAVWVQVPSRAQYDTEMPPGPRQVLPSSVVSARKQRYWVDQGGMKTLVRTRRCGVTARPDRSFSSPHLGSSPALGTASTIGAMPWRIAAKLDRRKRQRSTSMNRSQAEGALRDRGRDQGRHRGEEIAASQPLPLPLRAFFLL